MDINHHLQEIYSAIQNKNEIIFLNLINELEKLNNSSLKGIIELNKNTFYLNLNFSKENLLKFIANQKKFGSYPFFFQALIYFTFSRKNLLNNDFIKEISFDILYLYKNNINNDAFFKVLFRNREIFDDKIFYSNAYFDNIVVSALKFLAQIKNTEQLLVAEMAIYANYIKKTDTEAHFFRAYHQLIPVYENHGGRYASEFVSFPLKKINRQSEIIAFFLHSASLLAHVETLLNFLEGYEKIEIKKFTPVIFIFDGFNEDLDSILKKLKIETIYLDKELSIQSASKLKKIFLMKSIIKDNDIKVLVFISTVVFMAFIFGMRIAKTQIWWSMKFHIPFSTSVDIYLTGGAQGETSKNINGVNWLTSPGGISGLFDKSKSKEAKKIRANFPGNKIVLGSLSREEKLNSRKFLEAVALILEANPNTIFLWTGKEKNHDIDTFFLARNLNGRVTYIGWVDAKLYSQVIDIFLDSFPNPAGFTIYYAMASSVACVFGKISDETMGIQNSISPLYFNKSGDKLSQLRVQEIFDQTSTEPLYMLAKNDKDYVFKASKLIREKEFRKKVGNANRLFIKEFFSDNIRMAYGYAFHLNKFLT